MKQHFTDERTGIRYTLQGDYYLPICNYHPKKKPKSAYGGSGIYGI